MNHLRHDLTFKEYCQFRNFKQKHWHGAQSGELINYTVERLFDLAADYIDWKFSVMNGSNPDAGHHG